MSRITIDSGTNRTAGTHDDGAEPPGVLASLLAPPSASSRHARAQPLSR
jgi:hypothetical protein